MTPTIDEALREQALLGAALGFWRTWTAWLAVLRAAFGLPLDAEQLATFAAVAGDRKPPAQRVRKLWAICGRRAGKPKIAAAIAIYLAVFVRHKLSLGERGMVLVLAASQDQARVVFDYAKAFLESSPVLAQEIEEITRNEIRLVSGIVISTHANTYRTVRGRTLVAAIFDEVAIWRDELSATPDVETYSAVLPSLLTTKGMLIGISTGYRKAGLLFQKYREYFGQDSDDTLVVQGSTLQFNSSLTEADIAGLRAADPAAAPSEWLGTFREDAAAYLDDELIEHATDYSRPLELPPRPDVYYVGFTDAAGGVGQDAYTLAIGHKEGEQYVIDLVRGTSGKFDPQAATLHFASVCKEYHVSTVIGDSYTALWVSGAWHASGVKYERSQLNKSQIYLEALPLFARHLVRMPSHAKLLKELRLLDLYNHRGGRQTVDHPRGAHDDHANAVCGCLRALSDSGAYVTDYKRWNGEPSDWLTLRNYYYVATGGRWVPW